MISLSVIILTLFVILATTQGEFVGSKADSSDGVTILQWQYCESCKLTVDLYGQLFFEELNKFYKKGPKSGDKVDSSQIVSMMCDNPFFDQFQPFARYGCMKTVQDSGTRFLQQFSGQASAIDIISKASGYRRRKEVILTMFITSNVITLFEIDLFGSHRCLSCGDFPKG